MLYTVFGRIVFRHGTDAYPGRALPTIDEGNISFNSDLAEMQRLETAERTEKYFSERAIELSEKEIEKAASQYLSDYGIKRGEFEIYIKTAENPDGTQTAYLLLRLPQRVAEHYLTISRALEYRLGADVRIETYGTTEESR